MDRQLSAVTPIDPDAGHARPVVTGCPARSAPALADAADRGGVAA
ncbi:hypothetical protein RCG68_00120 [Kocuria sp. CPCC 205290]